MWTVRLFGWAAPSLEDQLAADRNAIPWRPRQGFHVDRLGFRDRDDGSGFGLYLGIGLWWRRLQFQWWPLGQEAA